MSTLAVTSAGIVFVLVVGLAPVPVQGQQAVQTQAGMRTPAFTAHGAGGPVDVFPLETTNRSGYLAELRHSNIASHTWTPSEDIVVAKASSRPRHVAIGAGIGALVGIGAGIALSIPGGTEGSMIPPPLIIAGGALLGAGIGALIGAAAPSGH